MTKFLKTNAHFLTTIGVLGTFGALLGLGSVSADVAVPVMTAAAGITLGATAASAGTPPKSS